MVMLERQDLLLDKQDQMLKRMKRLQNKTIRSEKLKVSEKT